MNIFHRTSAEVTTIYVIRNIFTTNKIFEIKHSSPLIN
jgi:hypothetical protein